VILEVESVSFSYSSRLVLRDIRFKVERGEILVILGPNGVGKTTLLKCMNAILHPDTGTVLVDGESVLSLDSSEIARLIGYVAQYTERSRLTVFDAILMGRHPYVSWKVSKKDLTTVDAAVKLLGLGHLALRYIDQMSGGELQKVAIARALVQEPRLLLLDEPTSNLDLKNQVEILNLLRRIVREHGVSAVMTMHDLNKALRYADKYLFLKDGMIFGAGKVGEVTAEMVQAVYGLPVQIHSYNGYPVVIPLEEDGKI
jgi:iron complex transport system ATP-binding protein